MFQVHRVRTLSSSKEQSNRQPLNSGLGKTQSLRDFRSCLLLAAALTEDVDLDSASRK